MPHCASRRRRHYCPGRPLLKTVTGSDGVVETRGYDPRNRLQSMTYSDGSPSVSLTWTGDNLPDTSSRGNVSRTWSYNTGRLLETLVEKIGSASYTFMSTTPMLCRIR